MHMSSEFLNRLIFDPLLDSEHEMGGILGSCDGEIVAYYMDIEAEADRFSYAPCIAALNKVIEEWWREGIAFAGFYHTHLHHSLELSRGDREYISAICRHCGSEELYFPVISIPERQVRVYRGPDMKNM